MEHQNQANFINTQTGCTDTQPAWGGSLLMGELWAGQRDNAAKPRKVQFLPWNSHGDRAGAGCWDWNQEGTNTGASCSQAPCGPEEGGVYRAAGRLYLLNFLRPWETAWQPSSSPCSDVPFASFMNNSPRRDFRENIGLKYSKYSRTKSGIFRIPAGSLANQVSHIHPSLMMIIMHQQLSTVQWMRI